MPLVYRDNPDRATFIASNCETCDIISEMCAYIGAETRSVLKIKYIKLVENVPIQEGPSVISAPLSVLTVVSISI